MNGGFFGISKRQKYVAVAIQTFSFLTVCAKSSQYSLMSCFLFMGASRKYNGLSIRILMASLVVMAPSLAFECVSCSLDYVVVRSVAKLYQ